MILIVVIGFLLALGIALIVLEMAISRAPEGHEDNAGFHYETHQTPEEWADPDRGITLWDQVEGACCTLDMRPSLRQTRAL